MEWLYFLVGCFAGAYLAIFFISMLYKSKDQERISELERAMRIMEPPEGW